MNSVRFNFGGLDRLRQAMGEKKTVRVGILAGDKMARKNNSNGANMTNAQIGAVQEYGSFTRGIPPRSFLFRPLSKMKNRWKITERAKAHFMHCVDTGEANDLWDDIGAQLVATVHKAFDQSGPGWPKLSDATIYARQHRKIAPRSGTKPLIDLGELRRSISFKVMK